MNPEVKKQWVDALRSGIYKKGYHVLRKSETEFCCLGVLCDLHAKATGEQWTDPTEDYGYLYAGKASFLPLKVAEWAELYNTHRLIVDGAMLHTSLSRLNDNDLAFTEIADMIEKQL